MKVSLVPFSIHHYSLLAVASKERDFIKFLRYHKRLSKKAALADARNHLRKQHEGLLFMRSIQVDGQIVGKIGASKRAEWELWYWIVPTEQGKGYASEAIDQFLDIFPHDELIAYVHEENARSVRVLRKCGFRMSA